MCGHLAEGSHPPVQGHKNQKHSFSFPLPAAKRSGGIAELDAIGIHLSGIAASFVSLDHADTGIMG